MLKERRGELYTVYRLRGSVPLYSVGKLFRYANTFSVSLIPRLELEDRPCLFRTVSFDPLERVLITK